jgi:hypothetical protein
MAATAAVFMNCLLTTGKPNISAALRADSLACPSLPYEMRNAGRFAASDVLQFVLVGILVNMSLAVKTTRTFSLDKKLLDEIKRTKGALSESKRVNDLLRLALDREKHDALEREIAAFFAATPPDRTEREAFESSTSVSWARD